MHLSKSHLALLSAVLVLVNALVAVLLAGPGDTAQTSEELVARLVNAMLTLLRQVGVELPS